MPGVSFVQALNPWKQGNGEVIWCMYQIRCVNFLKIRIPLFIYCWTAALAVPWLFLLTTLVIPHCVHHVACLLPIFSVVPKVQWRMLSYQQCHTLQVSRFSWDIPELQNVLWFQWCHAVAWVNWLPQQRSMKRLSLESADLCGRATPKDTLPDFHLRNVRRYAVLASQVAFCAWNGEEHYIALQLWQLKVLGQPCCLTQGCLSV